MSEEGGGGSEYGQCQTKEESGVKKFIFLLDVLCEWPHKHAYFSLYHIIYFKMYIFLVLFMYPLKKPLVEVIYHSYKKYNGVQFRFRLKSI